MREIFNCRITEVKAKIRKDFSITVKVEFSVRTNSEFRSFSKKFYNVKEEKNFKVLMDFANAQRIKELKSRIVRAVIDEDKNFIGIGDGVGDTFILFSNPDRKYTAAELNEQC